MEIASAMDSDSLPSSTVLIVDDDKANLDSVCKIFQREGFQTLATTQGKEALEWLLRPEVSVVVSDLMMAGVDGQELLRASRSMRPDVEVILMTAYATVETAVSAMREGAYDFITKPLKRHSLVRAVEKALEKQALVRENQTLRARLGVLDSKTLIGQSPAFRAFYDSLLQIAPSSASVLLTGESGTGKELAARALHGFSLRAKHPFVAVNCAALPESILEAELFGVERGAYTGATSKRDGRFVRANKGTLFLDEVGDMSSTAQVKLLRVLQEGEIERLGGTQSIKVDVRFIAATHKNLHKEVQEGRFREDLFYRLNVVELHVPSLASRREDIPLLAEHFLKRFCLKNNKPLQGLTPEALAVLENHSWPGNVRELEHSMERAVVLCRNTLIDLADLPESVRKGPKGYASQMVIPIGTSMEEIERRVINETLRYTRGDKNLAAHLLGIATRTIYRKLATDETEPQEKPPPPLASSNDELS